ncbi:hypothetical protein [uncultured Shewanella sp.]|uniref:hypothetical protein n=1 Tax=uncultured Shewanella sp. TaxID=173975 RepID=UPI00260F7B2B|nr:hypothetical protein [uncultured Shewanella sp.]
MSNDIKDIENNSNVQSFLKVIKQKQLVTWFSGRPALTPLGLNDSIVPIIMWSFVDEESDISKRMLFLIDEFKSDIGWKVERLKYNARWRLVPLRVFELAQAHSEYNVFDVAGILEQNEPEFGQLANQEMGKLAAYLERAL